MLYNHLKWIILGLLTWSSCTNDVVDSDKLFSKIDIAKAGITFENTLTYTEESNVYTFRNFYNGAGVGLGDFNRDGLTDIFFCGNQVDNQLYLNKGAFQFENSTDEAGVASENVWSTGVSIVDINGDGWLDIYVCKSGDSAGENRHNELFINQGITDKNSFTVRFKEASKEYGLDDLGLSTHAAFFDYDLDGDLDCYLLNNSFRSIGNYDLRPDQRLIRDTLGGNKLFRNNSISNNGPTTPVFADVSEEAGIYGSSIGFGLGVTFGDVNHDGWPDVYVSNDFFEKDYLYINQQDGTFEESIDRLTGELSMGSMGADMADINNDALMDIFVTEMLPASEQRSKTKSLFEDWNKYNAGVNSGYHHQFARNVLQLNNGEGNFTEIGRFASVEATDWSWGALIFDMDNDGWKDLFVANGIYKDLLDQDYINFYSNPAEVRKILFDKDKGGLDKLVDMIPSEPLSNFAFQNNQRLQFENKTTEWGFEDKTFSNGAAYGDLDNDGDLDLVVNNINSRPLIYSNNAADEISGSHFIQIKLIDTTALNYYAIGGQVYVYQNGQVQFMELNPARGFMSTVESRAHFGLNENTVVDSILIRWPDLRTTVQYEVPVDTLLTIYKDDIITGADSRSVVSASLLKKQTGALPEYRHRENDYSDFDKEPLLFQMHSNLGPASCAGDINNDGRTDFYIGGASEQAGNLFIQNADGSFTILKISVFGNDASSEDVDCIFFDANGDAFQDLYVASGSSEFGPSNARLIDRLYLNNKRGNFIKSNQVLPTFNFENSSAVIAFDYDQDGDQDLVVSTLIQPYAYGVPSNIYLLENDGSGNFNNVTSAKAPEFMQLGLIKDITHLDIDKDGDQDVVAVGEWMDIRFFRNDQGRLNLFEPETLGQHFGLWNTIHAADLDLDGDTDLIIGNHGLNSRLRASNNFPIHLYINDFDQNGKIEQVMTYVTEDGEFPFAQRSDLLKQLPYLNKKYPDYKSYALQVISDIFVPAQIESSLKLTITELRSIVLWNEGNNSFTVAPLPDEAQLSPIYAIHATDVNGDQIPDLTVGGNQYRAKPEFGINDASLGLLLLGSKNHNFTALNYQRSGLIEKGEIRSILNIGQQENPRLLLVKNNDYSVLYEIDDK